MLLLDALGSARGAARPRAQIVPVAEVGRIASFLLQLELLLVVPELVPSVAQQSREIRYPLSLGSDLSHEAANLLEIRFVRPRQLAVIPRSDLVEYRWPVGVVLLQVSVQIGLLAETPFAQRALERFLLVMNIPHVTLQVARDAEAPLAVLTLVRLLARVSPQVPRQIGRPGEHFTAELARVSVLRLQTCLHADRIRRNSGGLLLVLVLLVLLLLTRVTLLGRLVLLAARGGARDPGRGLGGNGGRGGRGGGESVGR